MDKSKELDAVEVEIIFIFLKNPIAAREKADDVFRQVIRHFGTQTEAARRLNLIQQTFNYRLNHAKTIHLEDVLMMVRLLRSEKTEVENWQDFMTALFISERAKLAIDELAQKTESRGRKSQQKASEENLIRHIYDELDGRTDTALAKKYGFGSRFSLREAMRVVKQGCREVIAAMDQKKIKIHLAAKLARLPKVTQRKLICQPLKAIRAYFNKKNAQSTLLKLADAIRAIREDDRLKTLEKKTKQPIIQHITAVLHTVCY